MLNGVQRNRESPWDALDFHEHGVEIRRAVLSPYDIQSVISEVSLDSETIRRGGIRNLDKKFASIARLAEDPKIFGLAEALLGGSLHLVRALFLTKHPR